MDGLLFTIAVAARSGRNRWCAAQRGAAWASRARTAARLLRRATPLWTSAYCTRPGCRRGRIKIISQRDRDPARYMHHGHGKAKGPHGALRMRFDMAAFPHAARFRPRARGIPGKEKEARSRAWRGAERRGAGRGARPRPRALRPPPQALCCTPPALATPVPARAACAGGDGGGGVAGRGLACRVHRGQLGRRTRARPAGAHRAGVHRETGRRPATPAVSSRLRGARVPARSRPGSTHVGARAAGGHRAAAGGRRRGGGRAEMMRSAGCGARGFARVATLALTAALLPALCTGSLSDSTAGALWRDRGAGEQPEARSHHATTDGAGGSAAMYIIGGYSYYYRCATPVGLLRVRAGRALLLGGRARARMWC